MYVVVNYKKNVRYPEISFSFDEAWDYYKKVGDDKAKIEYWDFDNNTCKLVWTPSYEENEIAIKNKDYWTTV